MSYEMGALIEPLSVGVHAARRADIDIGSSVLITGAGPIGMLSAIAARAKGACDIWITDVIDSRLGDGVESGQKFWLKTSKNFILE